MSQWIQHISGKGKILEVWGQTTVSWRVQAPSGSPIGLYDLPLEEYRLCDVPEVWEDVTEKVQWSNPDNKYVQDAGKMEIVEDRTLIRLAMPPTGYRFRKVSGSSLAICGLKLAFIVERRKLVERKKS